MMKRKLKKINLKLAFQLLIVTTAISSVLSISKFRSSVTANDTASVAIPILESTTITLDNIYPKMESKKYKLIVKNSNDNKSSEVSMNYLIDVEQLGNLPLKIELCEEGKNSNLLVNGKMAETKKIGINESQHKYELIITWDGSKDGNDSYIYSGETSYIKIDVNSVQAD